VVGNPTPGATFVYSVYLLPNTTNPIGVTSASSITGLVAGNYRVVALQSLGNLFNTQPQDIQILNVINPLVFQVSGQPVDCVHGTITVNVTQGNPATYEIISGPVIVPPQTSSTFVDLSVGQYVVRVNDVCGDGIVQTYNLSGVSNLNISGISQSCAPVSCGSTGGRITISTAVGSAIYYPLEVVTTIIPPNGGTPTIDTQIVTSGTTNPPRAFVDLNLPILNGLTYSYTVKVTDACQNTFLYNGSSLIRESSIEFLVTPEVDGLLSLLWNIDACKFRTANHGSFY